MGNEKINNILIPNISKLPESKGKSKVDKNVDPNEFQNLLNQEIAPKKKEGINISAHAAKRLQERNLNIDSSEYLKLKDAITKLKSKGGQDSLVITDKAAYIIDVNSNRIVTAIDKDNMAENVFTKIDSTLIV